MKLLAMLLVLAACGDDAHITVRVHNDVNGCWVELHHNEKDMMVMPGEVWSLTDGIRHFNATVRANVGPFATDGVQPDNCNKGAL